MHFLPSGAFTYPRNKEAFAKLTSQVLPVPHVVLGEVETLVGKLVTDKHMCKYSQTFSNNCGHLTVTDACPDLVPTLLL